MFTPFLRIPPVTATAAPAKLLVTLERMSVPAPALVSAVPVAVLVMAPLIAAVTAGLVTVSVRAVAPRFIAPESVRLFTEVTPPKVKSPFTVVALPTVKLFELRTVVPPAMVNVPVPTGPLVTAGSVPVVLTPKMRLPASRLKPLVKVLAPLRARAPLPVLEITPPELVIGTAMVSPVSERPAFTVITGAALLN